MYKKKVTLKDIALKAEVSPTTVSLILNGRESIKIGDDAKQRVLSAAKDLGYTFKVPSSQKELSVVCFVHEHINDINIYTSFFAQVAAKLRKLCEESGFIVQEIELNSNEDFPSYQAILARKPLAIISFSDAFTHIHRNQNSEIPLIFVQGDNLSDRTQTPTLHYVIDDKKVGELAAEHLLSRGYKNCGMIFPELEHRCPRERAESFITRFEESGGKTEHIVFDMKAHSEIEAWFSQLTNAQQDCFYFFSDSMAIPGIRALLSAGFQIPKDFGIIGTDKLYWGEFTYPSLTTMNLNEDMFANRIIADIEALKEGKLFCSGKNIISVNLIEREST